LDSVVSRGPLYWFQKLFDTHLPDWRQEPFSQRYAVGISTSDIWVAHVEAKRW
jgi:glycogen phosphorylase